MKGREASSWSHILRDRGGNLDLATFAGSRLARSWTAVSYHTKPDLGECYYYLTQGEADFADDCPDFSPLLKLKSADRQLPLVHTGDLGFSAVAIRGSQMDRLMKMARTVRGTLHVQCQPSEPRRL